MSPLSRRSLLFATLITLAFTTVVRPIQAQDDAAVKIATIDGVDLRGYFYPKKNAPVVIILHTLGGQSQVEGWKNLVAVLQAKYAVMLFDFRGHGESKSVDPTLFWNQQLNVKGVKQGPKKGTIDFKSFDSSYYPILINDIAAVKAFLDRKNDTGECNTSSTIVLGAETGATLGAIWLNSEWNRFRYEVGPLGATPSLKSEGKDVIATMWLSISPKLGRHDILLSSVLDKPVKQNRTATIFITGDSDTPGKSLANSLLTSIKGKEKKGDESKYLFIGAQQLGKNVKLKGSALLESNETNGSSTISKILDQIVEARKQEWTERDFRRAQFVWQIPNNPQLLVCKSPNEMNLGFYPYLDFIPNK